jgi:hypothetical protein
MKKPMTPSQNLKQRPGSFLGDRAQDSGEGAVTSQTFQGGGQHLGPALPASEPVREFVGLKQAGPPPLRREPTVDGRTGEAGEQFGFVGEQDRGRGCGGGIVEGSGRVGQRLLPSAVEGFAPACGGVEGLRGQ